MMPNNRVKIKQYLRDLPPGVLGVQNTKMVEILGMVSGTYNLNYRVRINGKQFIFRINIEQQSELPNQIEYEFRSLRFFEAHRIAPKVYHFDNTRVNFDFGILIEAFLEGPHLSLETEDILDAAELLAVVHSLEPGDQPWITWRDPLVDTYKQAQRGLLVYESRRTYDKKVSNLAKNLLAKTKALVDEHRHLYYPDSVNHTDVVRDNFIKTSQGLRLIDWEKPRIDDHTYDIAFFLSEPAQLWCSQDMLTQANRKIFLETYARSSGQKADLLFEKVKIQEPLISLHWILWGATRLCDIREHRVANELLQAHEERRFRYERIACPGNIEKLLESN